MIAAAAEAVGEMARQFGSRAGAEDAAAVRRSHLHTIDLDPDGSASTPMRWTWDYRAWTRRGSGRFGPTYRELLLPPWWMWGVVALFVVSVAVAYGFALGTTAGFVAALVVGAAAAALLFATTVTVGVDECVVRAGRARLPLAFVGRVEVLDKQASARARTIEFTPGAFPGAAHRALWRGPIRLAVTDPRDRS